MSIKKSAARVGAAAFVVGLSLAGPQAAGVAAADGQDEGSSVTVGAQKPTAAPANRASTPRRGAADSRRGANQSSAETDLPGMTARGSRGAATPTDLADSEVAPPPAAATPGRSSAASPAPAATTTAPQPRRSGPAPAPTPAAGLAPTVFAPSAAAEWISDAGSRSVELLPVPSSPVTVLSEVSETGSAPARPVVATEPPTATAAQLRSQPIAAAVAAPRQAIATATSRLANTLDDISARLKYYSGPVNDLLAGALALVRRTLLVRIPPTVSSSMYGGYVLREPDNPPASGLPADVIAAAQRIRAEAAAAEPQITRDMIDVANAYDGTMGGLDFRLKSEQSLARKIAERALASGNDPWLEAQKLSDVTRYTMVFPREKYAVSIIATVADLQQQSYQLRVKNYWQQGDPYQGINVAMIDPSGQKVELQFHTPASLAIKQGVRHKLYEIYRTSTEDNERWRLYQGMVFLSMLVPMPSWQVFQIGVLEYQPFEALS